MKNKHQKIVAEQCANLVEKRLIGVPASLAKWACAEGFLERPEDLKIEMMLMVLFFEGKKYCFKIDDSLQRPSVRRRKRKKKS